MPEQGRPPPSVLLVGAVTLDRFGSVWRPGGAPLYAARALAALGVPARALVLAGPGADLAAFEGHEVQVVEAETALRFEHEPEGESRRLRLASRPARVLSAGDLPPGWGDAELLVLAPLLADDLDMASFLTLGSGLVGLLAQGLQRQVAPNGAVSLAGAPSEALLAACDTRTSVFLSGEEVAGWPLEALPTLAARCARVVVTRGAAGAEFYGGFFSEFAGGSDGGSDGGCSGGGAHRGGADRDGSGAASGAGPLRVAAVPARAVDTTGGGDAFAAASMAALAGGADEAAAGALAARVAASTVERVGAAVLPRISPRGAGRGDLGHAGDEAVGQWA